jgi:hypothetical protein
MEHERLFGFVVSLVPEMEREKICQWRLQVVILNKENHW